jgi:hypothetical protein
MLRPYNAIIGAMRSILYDKCLTTSRAPLNNS